jgi:tetratricopeptide (TPR) repeat protein
MEEVSSNNDEDWRIQSENYKNLGNEAFQKGDNEIAIDYYSRAIDLDPENHVFYSNRSAAYMKNDSKSKALKDAEKCVELAPNWSKGYNRLGAAQQALKRYEAAIESFKKSIQYDNNNQSLWSALTLCKEAYEADKKSKFAEAAIEMAQEEERLKRLDEISVFQQLTQEDVRKIANILLKQLVDRILEQSKLVLFIDEDVKEKLAIDGFNPLYGARPLRRVIMNLVEDRLASLVLEKSYVAGTHLTLSLDEEENIIIAQTGFTKLVNENLSFKEDFDVEELNNKNPIQDVDSIIHDSIIFLKDYGFEFSE